MTVLFQIYKFKLLNSGVLIINFEQVPHVITVLLTLNKIELDLVINTICNQLICSKLTIKIPERRHWRRSGIFIINFEYISQKTKRKD